MRKNRESNKLVEKAKSNYKTRYQGESPDLDMKKQVDKPYKSRYSSSLIPENESEIVEKYSYNSRY